MRTVEELEQLSDGEYRTVLAARTLLAFLRTALAVLVVFRDSVFDLFWSLVATTGMQFVTASPLFPTTLFRVYGSAAAAVPTRVRCSNSRSFTACSWRRWSWRARRSQPWRYNHELEDRANAQAETDIRV